MTRLFNRRAGLPLAAMMPIGLLACESGGGYRPHDPQSPPYYYYDNFFNGSAMSHDGWGTGSWDSRSVEEHILEKYRRR